MSAAPWFDFDIRNDPVFQEIIKPLIEREMLEMKAYDEKRQALQRELGNLEITYIFHKHADEVADDVRKTAAALGQPEHVQEALFWATRIHDIGKRHLPIETWDLMDKPNPQTKRNRRIHTDIGLEKADEIFTDVADHPFVQLARDIIRYHHVNMDGSGYPEGVTGEALSPAVRLVCIVESYNGYATPRPHFGDRDVSPAAVLEKMRSEPDKGAKMFDMDLFEAFADIKLLPSPVIASVSDAIQPSAGSPRRPKGGSR